MTGKMYAYKSSHNYKYNNDLYTNVLTIAAGTFSNDSLGRFVPNDKVLIGSGSNSFAVSNSVPDSYTGRIGNVYYTYAGGANDAITFADFGETVYIRENATVEKQMEHGNELTVVAEENGVSYTGATTTVPNYQVATRPADVADGVVYYLEFHAVAAVYATSNAKNPGALTADKLVGYYGTVEDAFANAAGSTESTHS